MERPLSSTQLDASSPAAGAFVYSPPAGTVLPAGIHTLSAVFSPIDTTDYTTATVSVTITVQKAAPAITWSTPAPITYGTPLTDTQLNATASSNGSNVPGSFTYSPARGTVLPPGATTLMVTFTPSDPADYTTASASVTLQVNPATPRITWSRPTPITYPAPLSSTQLDALASVPGAFVYSPPAGAVLSPGNQVLSVTFTPTDPTSYTTATD